jgi:micrococcal nuclease
MGKRTTLCVSFMLAVMGLPGCSGPVEYRDGTLLPQTTGARESGPPSLSLPAARHRVVRVSDGDSLTLDSDGVIHQVRLSGIDAPELSQDFGRDAKAGLAAMVQGRVVTFIDSGQDSYHRNLVRLYVDGVDVNMQMVTQGLAWHYHAYSSDPGLAASEREARLRRRGLWSQPNPEPPWNWRRRH